MLHSELHVLRAWCPTDVLGISFPHLPWKYLPLALVLDPLLLRSISFTFLIFSLVFLECIPYIFLSKDSWEVHLLRTCMSSNVFILLCHSGSSVAGPFPIHHLHLCSLYFSCFKYYLLPFYSLKSLSIFKAKFNCYLLQEAFVIASVTSDGFFLLSLMILNIICITILAFILIVIIH